jgi:hypothetical protein
MNMSEAYKDGYLLAAAMAAKVGKHDGSEGHPINFERSGDYHRYMSKFVFEAHRADFASGYRDGWSDALKR